MMLVGGLAWLYLGITVLAAIRQSVVLRRISLWLLLVVAGSMMLQLPTHVRRLDAPAVGMAILFGHIAALAAFSLTDYSLLKGIKRLKGVYRHGAPRKSGRALGMLCLLASCEELAWRGAVQSSLANASLGALIATVGFSLAHLPPSAKVRVPRHADLIVLSILATHLVITTGSIVTAIIVHMIRNSACFIARQQQREIQLHNAPNSTR